MRRVAITGIGAISALGRNAAEFWCALEQGRSGIAPLETVDRTKLRFQNGAEVRGYNPTDYFDEKQADFMDRFAQFGVIAAREAIRDSGLDWKQVDRESVTILTGSCVGGQCSEDLGFVELYKNDRGRVHPLTIARTMANAGASHISMEFGITGPAYTISTACSSSNHAIGQAFWAVRSGVTELAITGGSEAVFSMGFLKAWEAMRVISPDTCRPFSKDRSGMILGEGAAMLVLEAARAGAGERRADSRGDRRLRHVGRRGSYYAAFGGRRGAGDAGGAAGRGHRAGAGGLHQRSRDRDPGQRSDGDGGDPGGLRRACRAAGGELDEIDARARAGRGGGARGGGYDSGVAQRGAAAYGRISASGSGLRSGCDSE